MVSACELAQHAEQLGFHRFWLAEHHNMAGIASAATSVAIGFVAEGTSTIRASASADHAWATLDSGIVLVAISNPAPGAASSTPWIALSSCCAGTLPIPLPISSNADERSAALGSVMFVPLLAPICT